MDLKFNSITAQQRFCPYLSNFSFQNFVSEGIANSAAHDKVYSLIKKIVPKPLLIAVLKEKKVDYLRNAIRSCDWARETLVHATFTAMKY